MGKVLVDICLVTVTGFVETVGKVGVADGDNIFPPQITNL
jgi:hypothetical protein